MGQFIIDLLAGDGYDYHWGLECIWKMEGEEILGCVDHCGVGFIEVLDGLSKIV